MKYNFEPSTENRSFPSFFIKFFPSKDKYNQRNVTKLIDLLKTESGIGSNRVDARQDDMIVEGTLIKEIEPLFKVLNFIQDQFLLSEEAAKFIGLLLPESYMYSGDVIYFYTYKGKIFIVKKERSDHSLSKTQRVEIWDTDNRMKEYIFEDDYKDYIPKIFNEFIDSVEKNK